MNLRRILVVKLADLGDLLTATPALRALREHFPTAEITALVTPHSASLLANNDACDRIISFPKALFDRPLSLARPRSATQGASLALRLAVQLRQAHFDCVVLLHHLTTRLGTAKYRALVMAAGASVVAGLDNGRGGFLTQRAIDRGFGERHEADYWQEVASALGAAPGRRPLELHLSAVELAEAAAEWMQRGLGSRTVAIHPGSGLFSVERRWPPERFARVADELVADGLQPLIVSGPDDADAAERMRCEMRETPILLQGVRSPRRLAALLSRAALFVGNDSGVMHLAAACQVPVVAVFGLSNANAWGPYPPVAHRVVRLDLPCSPCFYRGHALGTPRGCPTRQCLNELQADAVIAAARELLVRARTGTDQITSSGFA